MEGGQQTGGGQRLELFWSQGARFSSNDYRQPLKSVHWEETRNQCLKMTGGDTQESRSQGAKKRQRYQRALAQGCGHVRAWSRTEEEWE